MNRNRALTKDIKEGDYVQVLKGTGEPDVKAKVIRVNPMSLSYVLLPVGAKRDEVILRNTDEVQKI